MEEKCWIAATTSARTILSTTSRTPTSGSTSTLNFRAIISANPSPEIDEDTYTATTTLTALAL
ncbi:MAG: hypothetical protein G01um1014107_247 [Parcubacteria group bacterium Gr01-1014_107]|nr:MAG: hypothetical protein G01um1014107_247 [Parcubacteria group bacterium Gr01-1014_107]